MPEQTRRDFIKSVLGIAAVVAGSELNDYATTLEAMLREKPKRKYDTIAHDFLDIESEFGVTNSDYQTLDNIIDEAKKRIKIKEEYTEGEARNVLKTIDEILKDMGFSFQENILLNRGLKNNKEIDCDNCVVLYLAIADILNLPLKAVRAPEHIFVRWHFDKDNYVNWETTSAAEYSDRTYQRLNNIADVSIENDVFLESLSREETYFIAHNDKGCVFSDLGEYEEAIKSFDKAIESNPNASLVYNNKGIALRKSGEYLKAIENYNITLELDPNNPHAYNNKGVAFYNLERHEEAIENYEEALRLNSKSYFTYNKELALSTHNNKGLALYHLERYEEAIESYDEALRLSPDSEDVRSNREDALDEL